MEGDGGEDDEDDGNDDEVDEGERMIALCRRANGIRRTSSPGGEYRFISEDADQISSVLSSHISELFSGKLLPLVHVIVDLAYLFVGW